MLGVKATVDMDEIRTIVADVSRTLSPAVQQAYSARCIESLRSLLERRPRFIVAFGEETRRNWMELAQQTHAGSAIQTLDSVESLTLPSHPSTTIFFALAPTAWTQSHALLAVLAKAHDLPAPSAAMSLESDPILSVTPSQRPSSAVVHIEIASKHDPSDLLPQCDRSRVGGRGDHRFSLSSGHLTHNSVENIEFWKECRDFRHLSYADVPKDEETIAKQQAELDIEIDAEIKALQAAANSGNGGASSTDTTPSTSPKARRQSLFRIQGLDVAAAFDLFVDAAVVPPPHHSQTDEYMSVASLTEMLRFFQIPIPPDASVLAEMASLLGYDPTSEYPRIDKQTFVRVMVNCENGE